MSLARVLLVLILLPALAHAALFKCKDSDGHFTYSDQPCAGVDVPILDKGSISSVKIPPRQFVPAYQEDNQSSGKVSSSGGGGNSSSSSGSSKPAPRSHY